MNVTVVQLVDRCTKHIGKFLYLVNPNETTFEFPNQVPDYHRQIWPPFFLLLLLEQVILITKNKKFRLNDQVTSLSHWVFDETIRVFSRGSEYYLYIFIYEKYRWWDLAWNSPWTWYISAIGVEFCYYWAHRCNHEVHFLWAFHQVHHSSEEFNLAVGVRQSILQQWCNSVFYLPLALFIPPSHFIAHKQFNLIYQLCLHTTLIGSLGPLEWILNTAKHHRVHHGCNLHCLDKNYGGVLIIWDRLFGTFQEKEQRSEIIYGLVVNVESFNPIYLQIFYIRQLIEKSIRMDTWADKLAVFWKGPSWFPGGPRLGLDEYKIDVKSRTVYDTCISRWQNVYIVVHFCTVIIGHFGVYSTQSSSNFSAEFTIANNLVALLSIGLLFNKCENAGVIELARCVTYVIFAKVNNFTDICVYVVHLFSLCSIWTPYYLKKLIAYNINF